MPVSSASVIRRAPNLVGAALGLVLGLLLATAAAAQELADSALAGHDTDQPIEITADRFEVVTRENLAIFSGNVDAVQGEMILRADRLDVFYRSGGGGEANAVRRVEAQGNVTLTSPSEVAQGDAGAYEVVAGEVTMDGNVVLTRDQNVIRGNSLFIDLVSGEARVDSAVTAQEGGEPEDRVRALFVPDSE